MPPQAPMPAQLTIPGAVNVHANEQQVFPNRWGAMPAQASARSMQTQTQAQAQPAGLQRVPSARLRLPPMLGHGIPSAAGTSQQPAADGQHRGAAAVAGALAGMVAAAPVHACSTPPPAAAATTYAAAAARPSSGVRRMPSPRYAQPQPPVSSHGSTGLNPTAHLRQEAGGSRHQHSGVLQGSSSNSSSSSSLPPRPPPSHPAHAHPSTQAQPTTRTHPSAQHSTHSSSSQHTGSTQQLQRPWSSRRQLGLLTANTTSHQPQQSGLPNVTPNNTLQHARHTHLPWSQAPPLNLQSVVTVPACPTVPVPIPQFQGSNAVTGPTASLAGRMSMHAHTQASNSSNNNSATDGGCVLVSAAAPAAAASPLPQATSSAGSKKRSSSAGDGAPQAAQQVIGAALPAESATHDASAHDTASGSQAAILPSPRGHQAHQASHHSNSTERSRHNSDSSYGSHASGGIRPSDNGPASPAGTAAARRPFAAGLLRPSADIAISTSSGHLQLPPGASSPFRHRPMLAPRNQAHETAPASRSAGDAETNLEPCISTGFTNVERRTSSQRPSIGSATAAFNNITSPRTGSHSQLPTSTAVATPAGTAAHCEGPVPLPTAPRISHTSECEQRLAHAVHAACGHRNQQGNAADAADAADSDGSMAPDNNNSSMAVDIWDTNTSSSQQHTSPSAAAAVEWRYQPLNTQPPEQTEPFRHRHLSHPYTSLSHPSASLSHPQASLSHCTSHSVAAQPRQPSACYAFTPLTHAHGSYALAEPCHSSMHHSSGGNMRHSSMQHSSGDRHANVWRGSEDRHALVSDQDDDGGFVESDWQWRDEQTMVSREGSFVSTRTGSTQMDVYVHPQLRPSYQPLQLQSNLHWTLQPGAAQQLGSDSSNSGHSRGSSGHGHSVLMPDMWSGGRQVEWQQLTRAHSDPCALSTNHDGMSEGGSSTYQQDAPDAEDRMWLLQEQLSLPLSEHPSLPDLVPDPSTTGLHDDDDDVYYHPNRPLLAALQAAADGIQRQLLHGTGADADNTSERGTRSSQRESGTGDNAHAEPAPMLESGQNSPAQRFRPLLPRLLREEVARSSQQSVSSPVAGRSGAPLQVAGTLQPALMPLLPAPSGASNHTMGNAHERLHHLGTLAGGVGDEGDLHHASNQQGLVTNADDNDQHGMGDREGAGVSHGTRSSAQQLQLPFQQWMSQHAARLLLPQNMRSMADLFTSDMLWSTRHGDGRLAALSTSAPSPATLPSGAVADHVGRLGEQAACGAGITAGVGPRLGPLLFKPSSGRSGQHRMLCRAGPKEGIDLLCGRYPSKAVRQLAADSAFMSKLLAGLPGVDPHSSVVRGTLSTLAGSAAGLPLPAAGLLGAASVDLPTPAASPPPFGFVQEEDTYVV